MENQKNSIQWASIPLLIPFLLTDSPREKLKDILFKTSVQATQKYDGTNVGKDEYGIMYGRTLIIPDKTGSYQKTPLDCVRKVDTMAIKTDFCKEIGLNEDEIICFNLYGELMCNKSLFNYANEKLGNTHQIFGAMIKPKPGSLPIIIEKIEQSQFSCMVRSDEGCEESAENSSTLVMLFMNPALKNLVFKYSLPCVPIVNQYDCIYSMIEENFNWMVDGRGEGLVTIFPFHGSKCNVAKWKIGNEANANNLSLLRDIIKEIEDDDERKLFGEFHDKAIHLFKQMNIVANSKKVNGEEPIPVKPVKPANNSKKQITLKEAQIEVYNEAIKSAQSKFDHQDSFFVKNMKGAEEYASLIAKECLKDIEVDKSDTLSLSDHNAYILGLVKEMFVTFKKNNAKK